jgi:SAM-dependent methyltransferase
MTTDEVGYTLDNTWEKAHRRVTLLEETFDPFTRARLSALGLGAGWRCLELGAGAGSITRWLCDQVGDSGTVTAVDIEPRFLEADPRPNMEIAARDIVADWVPDDGYDLIHARALLMHLPIRDRIGDLVSCLRPGGVILLEEADCYPCTTARSATYVETIEWVCAAAAKRGGDWYWARDLPVHLAAGGAADVGAVASTHLFNGGAPLAQFLTLSLEQMTPLLLADGVTPQLLTDFATELADARSWFPAFAMVSAWGHRPL